ncbi:sulfatase-like hydrolase/transferase [Candidatus Pelagibacter sp. HIMB1495]|uniref:sulfatase-like hydrolase/transferase n=1 Tax=unclassified Candidatus Pelagibacter TaxID=2647897 RepID=UPI003F84DEEC
MISSKLKNLTQLILDLNISALFVFLNMLILRYVLIHGPTAVFLDRSYKLVGLAFVILGITFVLFYIKTKNFRFKCNFEFPKLGDFLLISFPMSPVIGFAIINSEYLNLFGFVQVIGVSLIFSIILSLILPLIFSYISSYKMLMISGLALSFTILTMPSITSNPDSHFFNSQFITQLIYLSFSFLIIYIFYLFHRKIAYTITVVFMLTGTAGSFYEKYLNQEFAEKQSTDRLEKFINEKKNEIIDIRNIYILVYESYPNIETLEHYGFDNSKQINFLENNNFKIYSGIYSNAASSLASISRVFDISGKLSKNVRYYTSGNAFGLNVFKANGYDTVTIYKSPYFFGEYPITWDKFYPKANIKNIGGETITKAIYEGEFRFDIFDDNYSYEKYLKLKKKYLVSKPKKPILLYSHNGFPGHSSNSGKCSANEKQNYFNNLEKANIEMKNDINAIKNNNPNSIIILLGDHGPYLTKNCTVLRNFNMDLIDKHDVQDRYGAFLAIHWPEKLPIKQNDIELIQDIFPTILSNVTKNQKAFDELKIDRKFFDRFTTRIGGVNVSNGILIGGKNDGEPLFDKRSYKIKK